MRFERVHGFRSGEWPAHGSWRGVPDSELPGKPVAHKAAASGAKFFALESAAGEMDGTGDEALTGESQ